MIMRQNYFLDLLAVDLPSASSSGNTSSTLEHDPEKWVPFSLGTNAKRLPGDHAQTKRLERDDDSKKSHPALVLRTLPALLSTVQIFSHSSAETASAQCPSRSGVMATSRKNHRVQRTIQTNR
jgi:hypothetical protein